MSKKIYKIKKARTNIKLLEDADRLAISKIDDPKYKKILTEQERQLNHYLAQYKNPDYLPDRIATEYEFPRYFYYTVNSKKNGITQRRTRTDSLMFKKFMKNKTKRDMAHAQGVFKILDTPIKMNINMAPAYPKKPKTDFKSILGNVSFDSISNNRPPPRRKKLDYQDPQYEYTGKPTQYIKEDIGSNLEYELDKKIEEVNKKLEKKLLELKQKPKKKPYNEYGSIQTYDVPKYKDEKDIDKKLEEVNKKLKSQLFNLKSKLSDRRYREVKQKMEDYKNSLILEDMLASRNKTVDRVSNKVINDLISNIRPYVPPNVELNRNIEDLISRRNKIDSYIRELEVETNKGKIDKLISDIKRMAEVYNIVYDDVSQAWDPNWVKKEFYLD
jgi:hypothetical protein